MLYLLLFAVLIAVLLVVARTRRRPHPAPLYQRRGTLLREAEWAFFQVLRRAVGERGLVMVKVHVADVIQPAPQRDRRQSRRLLDAIAGTHFDYLICSPVDSRPILAIALDDRKRDERVAQAAAAAGLPLERFPARTGYALRQVREQLMAHLPVQPEGVALAPTPTPEPAPACRLCGTTMVRREVRQGEGGTRPFWVCGHYPRCRGARPAEPQSP